MERDWPSCLLLMLFRGLHNGDLTSARSCRRCFFLRKSFGDIVADSLRIGE